MKLKDELKGVLPNHELKHVPNSYDVVGDIAIVRIPEVILHRSRLIAEVIMNRDKHVRTVLRQSGPVEGEYRLRNLEYIVGERRMETIHREYGCIFKVDLKSCYFSPRLSYERIRIAKLVNPDETIVNMFAGVGCFSILIAKHRRVKKIYSIDINPSAVHYHIENNRLNRVEDVIEVIEGDAKDVINERLRGKADRVLMPLPERAYHYIEYAILSLKEGGGWIHYYDFEHAAKGEDPIEKVKSKVDRKLTSLKCNFELANARIVRDVGPRWHQVALDIKIGKKETYQRKTP